MVGAVVVKRARRVSSGGPANVECAKCGKLVPNVLFLDVAQNRRADSSHGVAVVALRTSRAA
jgi:hypothetical protein